MLTEFKLALRAAALVAVIAAVSGCSKQADAQKAEAAPEKPNAPAEVALTPEALKSANIAVEAVGARPVSQTLRFTGTVEANQQATQQITPLVGGRVDQVNASLGTRVNQGALLAVISSPEVAEMHGKLLEAQARLNLANKNLQRIERLTELGAAAGKDLAAAQADMQTAEAEVAHLRNSLQAIDAIHESAGHNIAAVNLRSPITGIVTERFVNPGSGVESGKPLFTVANLSSVWVIANVPESQIALLHPGAAAQVSASALGNATIPGSVTFIDPNLNEQTRTARVRVTVPNRNELLKVGMFCEVAITPNVIPSSNQLMVPESALQRVGDRTVVFVEKGPGKFEVRNVGIGEKVSEYRIVTTGLAAGERVVTNGSFTLKSQLLKSEFAEEE